jgi:hypothetical protein
MNLDKKGRDILRESISNMKQVKWQAQEAELPEEIVSDSGETLHPEPKREPATEKKVLQEPLQPERRIILPTLYAKAAAVHSQSTAQIHVPSIPPTRRMI